MKTKIFLFPAEQILTYVVLFFESIGSLLVSKVKVKESRNRPDVAQRVPGGLGSQIS